MSEVNSRTSSSSSAESIACLLAVRAISPRPQKFLYHHVTGVRAVLVQPFIVCSFASLAYRAGHEQKTSKAFFAPFFF
jgi:hypothetical protein